MHSLAPWRAEAHEGFAGIEILLSPYDACSDACRMLRQWAEGRLGVLAGHREGAGVLLVNQRRHEF